MFPFPRSTADDSDLNRIRSRRLRHYDLHQGMVAWVRDGFPPQTNIVRVKGQRSVFADHPKGRQCVNPERIDGIRRSASNQDHGSTQLDMHRWRTIYLCSWRDQRCRPGNADCRVPDRFMILAFWAVGEAPLSSRPPSLWHPDSIIVLSAIGETINIMTLGGLAMAVGILVDDATVEVENINRNREAEQKGHGTSVLDSASQIATTRLRVHTFDLHCVLLRFLLSGVARYLFVPLAEAVVFAMLASYLLSLTIVPTMAKYLLRGDKHEQVHEPHPLVRLRSVLKRPSREFRHSYRSLLEICLRHRRAFLLRSSQLPRLARDS